MAKTKAKTTETAKSVSGFVKTIDDKQRQNDCLSIIEIMKKESGFEPKMWGPTIIGFGSYHYVYASGHEGDAPLIGFSPRKASFSLYIYSPIEKNKHLLNDLGKFKMGKACIYAKKLPDINIATLEKLCKETILYLNKHHECACRGEVGF